MTRFRRFFSHFHRDTAGRTNLPIGLLGQKLEWESGIVVRDFGLQDGEPGRDLSLSLPVD
jgi:hypothetical protein